MFSSAIRSQPLLLGLSLLLLLVGCSKKVTSSVQDQSLTAGPPKAEAKQEVPSPPQEAPLPPKEEERVVEPPPPPPAVAEPAPAAPEVAREAPAAAEPAAPSVPQSMLGGLADVFFDYDRFAIRNDAKSVLDGDGALLKAENGWKLMIAGHCDERGTVEYNLVLGERRAQAVKRYLEDLGVPGSSIQVTSFGKEKPFCTEHNTECWQKNRRVHFSIQ
ncbi:MAG: OmpA family protein [Nitrospirota bacterium]